MSNYEFCVQWVLDQHPAGDARVLDYGCGAGEIVKALRAQGIQAFGCDVFYEGGDYSAQVGDELLGAGTIRRMDDGRIPFDAASFDIVISNQVMEHVPDLDAVLGEISRVLKPGGKVLSLFPHLGVWREGHSGVPFLHRFPKGNMNVRVCYAAAFRCLGFGYFHNGKSVMHWSRDFCDWLDHWTYYRTSGEIKAVYLAHFARLERLEDRWLDARTRGSALHHIVAMTPRWCRRLATAKMAGLAFVAKRN